MVSSIDVAKHAGVSQTTVSRVLNNPEAVSEKTKLKVLRSIELLNYKPNSVARSLVSNETKTISLISGPLHNPFFVEATSEIVNYCKSKNYNVNVYIEDNEENKHDFYQAVFSNKVDGIILSSIFYNDEIYQELVKLKIPFVMLNRRHRNSGNYVEIDNVKAGMLATQHLIDLGHTDILWIGGSLEKSTFKGRFEGYKKALSESDMAIKTDNIIITDTDEQAIYNELEKKLLTKLPTGIQASTDSIAIFVLNFLLSHSIKVPEQISLIGIDGVGISDHASMKISTVSIVNDINMGRIAAEALLMALEDEESNEIFIERTYDVELKPRKTTGIVLNGD